MSSITARVIWTGQEGLAAQLTSVAAAVAASLVGVSDRQAVDKPDPNTVQQEPVLQFHTDDWERPCFRQRRGAVSLVTFLYFCLLSTSWF